MNRNKKKLNPQNSSPWLLCPSKSFPGEMYYFNTATGETAWSRSRTHIYIKKGAIHRVTDTTHTYPEPFDPPIYYQHNTTNSFTSLKNADNTEFSHNAMETRPPLVFGQGVFQKYVPPGILAPKFVWALTPMYEPNQVPSHRQILDQVTQTNQPIFTLNRFQSLKTNLTPSFQFQSEPFQYKDRPMFDQISNFNCYKISKEAQTLVKPPMKDEDRSMFDHISNFNCYEISKEAQTLVKPPMKNEACQTSVPIRGRRLRTQSESESTPKSVLKGSRSVENLTSLFIKDVETSTINPPYKVDNETGKLSELDKNDLRFKLVAKKRKIECVTETEWTVTVKSADQSTSKPREILTPKKRVTFDIQESACHSSDDVQETDQSPESSRMEELSQLTSDGRWYVVTDTTALLEGWQCIEDFVKSDPCCCLLLPYTVYTELKGHCHGDSGAMSARQLIWKLAVHVSHIVVQSKPEYELSSEDSILQCCWTLLQYGSHVVLISNNTNMLNKAKSIDLECYTLDRSKIDNQTTAEPQSDLKKPKIIEENDKHKSKNLFLQDLSEVNSLCLLKPTGFKVCEARNNIFETGADTGSQFSKRDANFDKLIDLTRPRVNTVFNSEITNAIDQITKLSIAGNISVNNQNTQIMKIVLRAPVLNKIDLDTTTVGIEYHNSNPSLSDKNNSDINNKNVPSKLKVIDEIDRDISRLNVTENNIENSSNIIKVSRITKLNNQFNLDEDLERFYIKNAMVENRIKSRLDEWVCRLNQTMEGVLTEILLEKINKMKRMMPPWNLFEAIQATGETFKNQPVLKSIVDRFTVKLLYCSPNKGELNKYIKPNDLMKLIGLSMILIEHLKEIVNSKELHEAEDMLVDLIKNIEDPESDIDLSLELVNTPTFSRNEISDVQAPEGFRKSRKGIVDYLKKHFAAWQTLDDNDNLTNATKDKTINKEANIVITCDKDLNTLKINKTKAITVENKAADKTDVANKPKVISNVKTTPAFVERLKNKAVSSGDDVKLNDGNENRTQLSDLFILDDLSVSASNINAECARKSIRFVKMFLMTLRNTLVRMYKFVQATLREYQAGISKDKKAQMLIQTERTRQKLLNISENLKKIIARESSDGRSVKTLLAKAAEFVEEDLCITNYTQIVTHFFEQAQELDKFLVYTLSLLNPAPNHKSKRGTVQ